MRQRNNFKKAVEVAKDVIKWIDSKRIKVKSSNGYVVLYNTLSYDLLEKFEGESLQKSLPKLATKSKPCEVCALGACFIAHVDKTNKFDIPNYDWDGSLDRSDMIGKLKDIFTRDQMNDIEDAFEADPTAYGYDDDSSAEKFGSKYKNDTMRLRAIMSNIIENNGVFKP